MRTYVRHQLRQGRRLAAAGVAVALSVLFVVTTLVATATLEAYVEASAAVREHVADVVVGPGDRDSGTLIDTAAVRRISALPQVASVAVNRTAGVTVAWPDGVRPVQVETAADTGRPWYRVASGRQPAVTGEVLLDASSAAKLNLSVGARLRTVPDDRRTVPAALVVTGLYRLDGPQPRSPRLLAPEPDVARWGHARAGEPDPQIHGIEVAGAAGISPEELATAIRLAVPQLAVRTGAEETQRLTAMAAKDVKIFGNIGLGFTAVAVLVAAIVIGNTFTVLLAQRSHELALLRCLGATRRQLQRATLLEAAMLGAAASAAGAGAAVGLILVATAVAGRFSSTWDDLHPAVAPVAVLAPIALGTLITVLASRAPARRAGRVAPVAALRPDSAAVVRRANRLRIGAAIVLATLAAPTLAIAMVGRVAAAAGFGSVLLVAAALSAIPVLVPWMSRIAGRLLHPAGPVVRGAAANTARNARRSAASSTALMVGILAVTTLSVLGATVRSAAAETERRQQPIDVIVSLGESGENRTGLRPGVLDGVSRIPGITAAATLRLGVVRIEPADSASPKADSPRTATQPSPVLAGDPAELRRIYRDDLPLTDDVLVAGSESLPDGVRDATRVILVAGGTRIPLTVRTATGLSAPVVTEAVGKRLGVGESVTLWARAQDDADPSAVAEGVRSVMRATGSGAGGQDMSALAGGVTMLEYLTDGSLIRRAELDQILAVAVRVSIALLAVAIVVSLAGIANTLALSVHERTRELGLARALGVTRRQQQAGLLVEALLIAIVGAGLGLVLGILLGWTGAYAITGAEAPVVPPSVPVVEIGGVVVLALVAAALASVLPGRRAARVSPVVALAQT